LRTLVRGDNERLFPGRHRLLDRDDARFPHLSLLNACRTPGYLALLTPFKQIDARWLVAFQLNLVVASQVAVAWAVSRLTASALAGVLSLAIATLFSHLDFLAFFVMSEAMFASAVGFAAAAAIVYVKSPSTWCAAVVGLSIAVALTVKAVAPAMAIVALLALLRPAADARIKALAMLGPPVICLVGLAGLGRISHGAWSPTNFGGYALAENVAWGIRNDSYSTDPKLSAAVEEKLQVFQHRWPAPTDVNAYLARSIDNLDAMFWDTMVPIVAGKHGLGEGAPHCPREVNASLTALGIEAIRRDPLRYAAHAAVQFYGLWGFALPSASWSNHARQTRRAGGSPMSAWNWRAAPSNWRPTPLTLASVRNGGAKYDANGLFVDRVKRHLGKLAAIFGVVPALLPRAQTPLLAADPGDADAGPAPAAVRRASIRIWQFPAVALGALTIALAALGPWIRRLPPEIAALALLALLINAYFAAHALFMFASVRYAASVEAPLAAFLAIAGYVTATTIVGRGMSRFRRPSSALQTAPQPS
jgi:hypothetical protein